MKRSAPLHISDVLRLALKQNDMEASLAMHKALAAWPELVGPTINRQTVARRVASGVLYLRIPSAVIRQELSLHRSGLIKALNSAAGEIVINEIRFV